MNLPGVCATDSMGYRIEALRVYLEQQLNDIPFIAAYKHLVNLSNDEETTKDSKRPPKRLQKDQTNHPN